MNPVKTPISAGLIARVVAGVKYVAGGQAPAEWFGAGEPLPPVVPENQQDSVQGRQWDFPVNFNNRIQPRNFEPVSFSQMRALADSCTVLRLVIETRKEQIAKLRWTVKHINPDIENDARCQKIMEFLKFPDKENTWSEWLRALVEDMFVIDAPAIYVRPTLGGDPYAFELVDGSTINRKIVFTAGNTP